MEATMVMVPVLGVVAGMLTTVAGLGGGMLLVLALSLFMEPAAALALTTPALLAGNLHRAWLYRATLDHGMAWRVVLGALPGSMAGGAVVGLLPPGVLRWTMLGLLVLAVTVGTGWLKVRVPHALVTPGAASIGVLASAGGGAGLLLAPLLTGAGLTGEHYLATAAAGALTIHAGRILAYGATGLFPATLLLPCAVLTLSVLAGNLAGRRLRTNLARSTAARVETTTLLISTGLAMAGLLVPNY